MVSPDNSTHGQCVQIAASPGFTKTFAMAVLPKLDDFAAGLDLAVLRPIVREKSRPSPRAQVREGLEMTFLDVFLCAIIPEIQVSSIGREVNDNLWQFTVIHSSIIHFHIW